MDRRATADAGTFPFDIDWNAGDSSRHGGDFPVWRQFTPVWMPLSSVVGLN
jgi:hypothetical protein